VLLLQLLVLEVCFSALSIVLDRAFGMVDAGGGTAPGITDDASWTEVALHGDSSMVLRYLGLHGVFQIDLSHIYWRLKGMSL